MKFRVPRHGYVNTAVPIKIRVDVILEPDIEFKFICVCPLVWKGRCHARDFTTENRFIKWVYLENSTSKSIPLSNFTFKKSNVNILKRMQTTRPLTTTTFPSLRDLIRTTQQVKLVVEKYRTPLYSHARVSPEAILMQAICLSKRNSSWLKQ